MFLVEGEDVFVSGDRDGLFTFVFSLQSIGVWPLVLGDFQPFLAGFRSLFLGVFWKHFPSFFGLLKIAFP
jgi:hypothetical protein